MRDGVILPQPEQPPILLKTKQNWLGHNDLNMRNWRTIEGILDAGPVRQIAVETSKQRSPLMRSEGHVFSRSKSRVHRHDSVYQFDRGPAVFRSYAGTQEAPFHK